MISGQEFYDVVAAIVPLYVAMILAYGSVRWWKIFTPEQCSGINRFVAVFALPFLAFHFISSNNPYAMNFQFIAADSLQKVIIFFALFLLQTFTKKGSFEWMITLFSIATLPNTLVMGIPLLKAMYGEFTESLMAQMVVLQSVIWYTLLLFMYEYRGAKLLISEQFPQNAASITSFRVESDVVSLNAREPLQADAEMGDDGKLHVVIRRSTSSGSVTSSYNKSHRFNPITPRASNLTGVEIYSIQSSREPTPRASSFNQTDFYTMLANKLPSPMHRYANSYQGDGGGSELEEEIMRFGKEEGRSMSTGKFLNAVGKHSNPMFSGSASTGGQRKKKEDGGGGPPPSKELHMFVWSSSTSPSSEGTIRHAVNRVASTDFGVVDSSKAVLPQEIAGSSRGIHDFSRDRELKIKEGLKYPVTGSTELSQKATDLGEGEGEMMFGRNHEMPPASVMTRLILIMVWRKLIRNPNTYASVIGLVWSLISFRWHIKMPAIVSGSIAILSNTGLGMAMFSLGLFMTLQPKIIACGISVATFSMAVKFLVGPAVMAATAIVIGIRGVLLRVAIVQAALPLGVVPFVFAKEYNVHANILSTSVIFGMGVALPVTIIYYIILGLIK